MTSGSRDDVLFSASSSEQFLFYSLSACLGRQARWQLSRCAEIGMGYKWIYGSARRDTAMQRPVDKVGHSYTHI